MKAQHDCLQVAMLQGICVVTTLVSKKWGEATVATLLLGALTKDAIFQPIGHLWCVRMPAVNEL